MNKIWHVVFPEQSTEEHPGRLDVTAFLKEDV